MAPDAITWDEAHRRLDRWAAEPDRYADEAENIPPLDPQAIAAAHKFLRMLERDARPKIIEIGAERGVVVTLEYDGNYFSFEMLPQGNIKGVLYRCDRSQKCMH